MESNLANSFLVCWILDALLSCGGATAVGFSLAFVVALVGDILGLTIGAAAGGVFFLSSLAFAFSAPGLAALATVFFFLTVGLLSVDPVDDFRLSSGVFLAAAVDAATAAIAAAVAGLTLTGFGAVGGICLGGMTTENLCDAFVHVMRTCIICAG